MIKLPEILVKKEKVTSTLEADHILGLGQITGVVILSLLAEALRLTSSF